MLFFDIVLSLHVVRCVVFFFQAEDGIRDAQESRGLGDVYKRQELGHLIFCLIFWHKVTGVKLYSPNAEDRTLGYVNCLLYTSDAADDLLCVDLGGRRIIKKKKKTKSHNDSHRR